MGKETVVHKQVVNSQPAHNKMLMQWRGFGVGIKSNFLI